MEFLQAKKYLTVSASFVIMLCLGGVYAWSIIASELIDNHAFSATQTQIIFGTLIAIFPTSMILVGRLARKIEARYLGYISGMLFFLGYLLASYSNGNFYLTLIGIGVLAGVATGFGYWVSLTIPVQWFPEKKGLITGIAAAGFGLGAVLLSKLSVKIVSDGKDVFQLLTIIGIAYGLIILISSNFINQNTAIKTGKRIKSVDFIHTRMFFKLLVGIFLGTFAGLLVIGSLKIIGEQSDIPRNILIIGVSLFAIANFCGRLFWGYLSDHFGASFNIFLALLVQALGILLLDIILGSNLSYLFLAILIGFGFGGNFVLFAKETAHVFGTANMGIIYPYVFLGYAVAGIAGPLSGGLLFDFGGTYTYAILLASIMSLGGSMLFLHHYIKVEKKEVSASLP